MPVLSFSARGKTAYRQNAYQNEHNNENGDHGNDAQSKAENAEDITVFGDAQMIRDGGYVKDSAHAFYLAI